MGSRVGCGFKGRVWVKGEGKGLRGECGFNGRVCV